MQRAELELAEAKKLVPQEVIRDLKLVDFNDIKTSESVARALVRVEGVIRDYPGYLPAYMLCAQLQLVTGKYLAAEKNLRGLRPMRIPRITY